MNTAKACTHGAAVTSLLEQPSSMKSYYPLPRAAQKSGGISIVHVGTVVGFAGFYAGARPGGAYRDLGSSTSRNPSPNVLKPKTDRKMVKPGAVATCDATVMKPRPSASIVPQSGVGG